MENVERKPLFALLFFALCSSLLLPVVLSTSAGNKNSRTVRSKRDSNPVALLSNEESVKNFVNSGKGDKLNPTTGELGFGQSIEKQRVEHILKDEEAKHKRLRDFIGKRNSPRSADSAVNPGQSGGDTGSDDDSSIERWPSFAAFQGDERMDSSVTKRSVDKRLRDFVGKRANYNKRLRDFVGKRDGDSGLVYDKRLRDFVGKRGYLPYPLKLQKRLRDFVGKRSSGGFYPFQLQKRLRDFVGKRDNDMRYPFELQKRLRDFVGKRDINSYSFEPQKRLRDFVGKRYDMENPSEMKKRLRDFVGKREYIPYPFEMEKRLRDFVGKRQVLAQQPSDIEKRLRDFVGKREFELYPYAVDKRLRDFVGKRDSNPMDLQKRLRDFVGKRDDDTTIPFSDDIHKRLRDFVGKRDTSISEVEKRLRDFVGKRSSQLEIDFPMDGPINIDGYNDWSYDSDPAKNDGPDEAAVLMDTQQQEEAFFDENPGIMKRAPIREFVGKRMDVDMVNNAGLPFVLEGDVNASLNGEDDDGEEDGPADEAVSDEDMVMAVSKRLRDFVGKRTGVDKRLRDFVGKRSTMADGLL